MRTSRAGQERPARAGEIARIAQDPRRRPAAVRHFRRGLGAHAASNAEGLTLEDKQATTRALLACGANIHELNCIRKHCSGIKGGQLARLAYPASVITLMLSDVIGDDPDTIGSGPTAPDRSHVRGRARNHSPLWHRGADTSACSRTVRNAAARGEIVETPKPGDAVFERVQNVLAGSNREAVDAAASTARALGYRTLVLSTTIQGELAMSP